MTGGVVSTSAEEMTRMITMAVEVFARFGLTVSEKKTEGRTSAVAAPATAGCR